MTTPTVSDPEATKDIDLFSERSDEFRWHARHNRTSREALRHDCAGGYYAPIPQRNILQEHCVCSDPTTISDNHLS
jgi:hypothetical protein